MSQRSTVEILNFTIHLLSAATLLLFSVRFMRIGVERLWSVPIRRNLSANAVPFVTAFKGVLLGFLMQGSTVVMLMATGLAGSGTIPLVAAAYLAIGADLGSALAVFFLTLPVSNIGPVLVLIGGWLYLNSAAVERHNLGRTILGLGLVFLSLSLIRAAVQPLQSVSAGGALFTYLNSDLVTVLIVAIALTIVMHSSLAAILTAVVIAAHADLAPETGFAFVLGCNIGSAILPLWLLRSDTVEAKSVAKSVAVLRVTLAGVIFAILLMLPRTWLSSLTISNERVILLGHLAFNMILFVFIPLAPKILAHFAQSDASRHADQMITFENNNPSYVLAALRAHVNKMLETLLDMFDVATKNDNQTKELQALEAQLNRSLSQLRKTYANLPEMGESESKTVQQILDFAIRIEASGDIINGKYSKIMKESYSGLYNFTEQGATEIDDLIASTRKGIVLAQNVLWRDDLDAAEELLLHKRYVSDLEEKSKRNHLSRVRSGNIRSLSSSDGHLEIVAALKSINSKLATIAYAVLDDSGKLVRTHVSDMGS